MNASESDTTLELLKRTLSYTAQEDMTLLLRVLLTEDERQSCARRLSIMSGLLAGKASQRQIAAEHGLGIATITRGSRALKSLSASERARLQDILVTAGIFPEDSVS